MEKYRKLMKNLVDISAMVTQSTNFFAIKDQIVDKMLEVVEPTYFMIMILNMLI